MPCGYCGGAGHNRTTCPSDPNRPAAGYTLAGKKIKNTRGSKMKKRGGGGAGGRRGLYAWVPKGCTPCLDGATGKIIAVQTTERCECGGTTGVCGTAEGARKWSAHQHSKKHSDFMTTQHGWSATHY